MNNPQRILRVEQGAGNKMHTLWVDYIGESEYVKPRFIKNLSTDAEIAIEKAMQYAESIGISPECVHDNTRDLNDIVRVYKWTDTMVRFGKHYGKELKDCPDTFVHWIAKGSYLQNEKNGEWYPHHFGGYDFCLKAQEVAVELGLGVIDDRYKEPRYVTQEQYDAHTMRIEEKANEKTGHFYSNGERLSLSLTCIYITGFSSDFGWMNIYKFKDAEGRLFTYRGSNEFYDVCKGSSVSFTATIKHGAYNGSRETYLQRIKF